MNISGNTSNEIIFGIRTVMEAIRSGKEIEKLLIKSGLQGDLFHELLSLVNQYHIPYQVVPPEKLNRITRKNHQGVVASISAISYTSLENLLPTIYEKGKTPLILILDDITDVRNFGAIARTAECAGIDALLIPARGSAQINADAMKTSAGALHFIPVCRTFNLSESILFLKNSGLQIIAATEKAEKIYHTADLTLPTAVILGGEDTGINSNYLALSDIQVRIPVAGKIDSLNVSVAASVILYEAIRQRK